MERRIRARRVGEYHRRGRARAVAQGRARNHRAADLRRPGGSVGRARRRHSIGCGRGRRHDRPTRGRRLGIPDSNPRTRCGRRRHPGQYTLARSRCLRRRRRGARHTPRRSVAGAQRVVVRRRRGRNRRTAQPAYDGGAALMGVQRAGGFRSVGTRPCVRRSSACGNIPVRSRCDRHRLLRNPRHDARGRRRHRRRRGVSGHRRQRAEARTSHVRAPLGRSATGGPHGDSGGDL